jgi:hypothetical protein
VVVEEDEEAQFPPPSRTLQRVVKARPTPPSFARPSTAASTSLVEDVLNEQLCPPADAAASPPLPISDSATTPTLIEVEEEGEHAVMTMMMAPRRRSVRCSGARQPLKTEGGAAVPSSFSPTQPALHEAEDEEEMTTQLAGEQNPDDDGAVLRTPLRLQPFPSTIPASAQVAAAMAEALGSAGVDGELADLMLMTAPQRPTLTSAQAALAAERASLLHDPFDDPHTNTAAKDRLTTATTTIPTTTTMWGAPASLQRGCMAALTPSAVAEFLAVEAAAEAAETASQPQTSAVDKGKTSRTSATVSAQAESAAVLRELQVMQQRLRERSGRHSVAHHPSSQISTSPHKQQRADVERSKGYGSSPCDISASSSTPSSSSSSSSLPSSSLSDRTALSLPSTLAVVTSVTDIVDAIDRGCSSTTTLRLSHGHVSRAHQRSRRRRGTAAAFDPAVYVHALLEGKMAESSSSLPSSCSSQTSLTPAEVGDEDVPPRQQHLAHTSACPSADELRGEMLRRAGHSWPITSTAAAAMVEVGVPLSEARELLRYSLSSPEAAVWLSGGGGGGGRSEQSQPQDQQKHQQHQQQPSMRSTRVEGEKGDGESSIARQQQQRREPTPYALDAATQTALVHRLVNALPAVPPALQAEMAHQRKLLERVCREVSAAAAPMHEAARARLTTPKAPAWVEFNTSGPPTTSSSGKDEGAAAQAYEAQLLAALPRPAAQALVAVAGLRSTAADPSQPLPDFRSVIARPPCVVAGAPALSSATTNPPQQRQPYEAALHELAVRETQHYVAELDRLRTTYDRQLAEERRQRMQERQQYAALLEKQQQRMLQHHRETVHLLQREGRLQQAQQDSLVQQLTNAQAAVAERQQRAQAQTTRQMLAGAVDALQSRCVTAAQMEAYAGHPRRRSRGRRNSTSAVAASLARKQRIHARRADHESDRAASAQPQLSSPPPAAATRRSSSTTTTTTTTPPQQQPDSTSEVAKQRCRVVRVKEPIKDGVISDDDAAAPWQRPFDADIPTSCHPTAHAQAASSTTTRGGGTADSPAGGDKEHLREAQPDMDEAMATTTTKPRPSTLSDASSAEDTHSHTSSHTGTSTPSPPQLRRAPSLQLTSLATLRAVYSPTKDDDEQQHQQHHQEALRRRRSAGAARPHVVIHSSPPHRPPPNTRMTLPLRVCLPPEDELDVYQRRVAAATAAVERRAATAAKAAGLAEGTKLYAVTDPHPHRQRRSREKPQWEGGGNAAAAGASATTTTPTRAWSVPPRTTAGAMEAQQRSRTASSRGRGGGGRRGRPSRTTATRGPGGAVVVTAAGGRSALMGNDRPHHPHYYRDFDVEVVTVLSSESETALPYPTLAPASTSLTSAQQQPFCFVGRRAPVGVAPAPFPSSVGTTAATETRSAAAVVQVSPSRQTAHTLADGNRDDMPFADVRRGAPTTSLRVDVAGIIAGGPCVGAPVVMLSDAVLPPQEGEGMRRTSSLLPRVSKAAAFTQALHRQLDAAAHHRARVVAELREAAERQATHARMTAVADTGGADNVSASALTYGVVGTLPPCDGGFFGAPADVMTANADVRSCSSIAGEAAVVVCDHDSNSNGGGGGGGSGLDAFDDLLLYQTSAPTTTTDYARAWGRYEAAERCVAACAAAVAAEDAGVLSTVARAALPTTTASAPLGVSVAAQPLPRQASTDAGVRYRERQLGYLAGDTPIEGDDAAAAEGGGMYVSARMAAEARALVAARRRLAQIRACFAAPPTFHADTAASVGTTTAAARTTTSMTTADRGLAGAGEAEAALTRQLVEETVFSLLEAEGAAQRDPIRQVVAAIEQELLRLMLGEHLAGGLQATTPALMDHHPVVDPALLDALVQAAVEEAVQTSLQQRHGKDRTTTAGSPHTTTASPVEARTALLARALQRYASGTSASASDTAVEVEYVPALGQEAVLQGRQQQQLSSPSLRQPSPSPSSQQQQQHEHVGLPVIPVTTSGDALATTSTTTTSATAALLPPPTSSVVATTSPQELRIVLDLSPEARHLLALPAPPPHSSAAATSRAPQPLSSGLVGSSPYPPVHYEQLPSRQLQLEDRRDVIVEAELLLPSTTTTAAAREEDEKIKRESRNDDDEVWRNAVVSVADHPPPRLICASASASAEDTAAQPTTPPLPVPPPPPLPLPPLLLSSTSVEGLRAPLAAPPPLLSTTQEALSQPSSPSPPPPVVVVEAVNATQAIFDALRASVMSHEAVQRDALVEREEEQRQSLRWVADLARRDAAAAAAAAPLQPAQRPQRDDEHNRVAAAVVDAATATITPLRNASAEAVTARTSTTAADNDIHDDDARPPLPPVRDPVMSAVLEWVQRFGSSPGARVARGPSTLVEQLQSAATAAAAASPPLKDETAWVGSDNGLHTPVYRGPGSTTSTASSASSFTPSLPSSLMTDSSLSSTATSHGMQWVDRIVPAAHAAHTCVTRVRPVLDAQQRCRAHRGGVSGRAAAAARRSSSGSSDTATTRYTTTTSPLSSARRSSDRPSAQPEASERTAAADTNNAKTTAEVRVCGDEPSRILPQRASAEVQAALAAALRAHHRRLAEDEIISSHVRVVDATAVACPDSRNSSSSSITRSDNEYVVMLPAQPAPSPPPSHAEGRRAAKEGSRRGRQHIISPTRSPEQQHQHQHQQQRVVSAAGRQTQKEEGLPTRSCLPAQWAAYSLTSTSTSTHGTRSVDRTPRDDPNAAETRGVVSSALPFSLNDGRVAVSPPPLTTGEVVTVAGLLPSSLSSPSPSAGRGAALMSPPPPPFTAAALRAEVLRVQREQRGSLA